MSGIAHDERPLLQRTAHSQLERNFSLFKPLLSDDDNDEDVLWSMQECGLDVVIRRRFWRQAPALMTDGSTRVKEHRAAAANEGMDAKRSRAFVAAPATSGSSSSRTS